MLKTAIIAAALTGFALPALASGDDAVHYGEQKRAEYSEHERNEYRGDRMHESEERYDRHDEDRNDDDRGRRDHDRDDDDHRGHRS